MKLNQTQQTHGKFFSTIHINTSIICLHLIEWNVSGLITSFTTNSGMGNNVNLFEGAEFSFFIFLSHPEEALDH